MAGVATVSIPNNPLYHAPMQLNGYPFSGGTDAITLLGGGVALLTHNDAGAYTLAVPTVDYVELTCIAGTAAAHVITQATVGFNAKGSSGTATFGGAIGDAVTLISYNGNWYCKAEHNVTFA